jgi:hypothetical protein
VENVFHYERAANETLESTGIFKQKRLKTPANASVLLLNYNIFDAAHRNNKSKHNHARLLAILRL